MFKNKYLLWILMQIMLYLIKKNDLILQVHDNMGDAALWVFICAVVAVGSTAITYYIWNVEVEEQAAALGQAYKKYNEIVINDQEIKPSEFLELQKQTDYANMYLISRSILLTGLTVILIGSVCYGYLNLEEYRNLVRYYRIINGIWNDGKVPNIKEWRECDNQ